MSLQGNISYYSHHRVRTEFGNSMKENLPKKTEQRIQRQARHFRNHERLTKFQSRSTFTIVSS
jgi:hypothetical protein